MGKLQTKAAANAMRNYYGTKYGRCCRHCCNCQKKSAGIPEYGLRCIAYSDTAAWDPDEIACGLYNTAFLGMRPRVRQLEEMRNPKRGPEKEQLDGQPCLFSEEGNEAAMGYF